MQTSSSKCSWSLPSRRRGRSSVPRRGAAKDVYLHDIALQRFVVEGAGVRVDSVELMHVEPDYVRGIRGIDWARFFRRVAVGGDTAAPLPGVPARVAALLRLLDLESPPNVEPGSHCFVPYACDFWDHCTAGKPADWVFQLPWLRDALWERLRAAGIERIADIPEDFPLSSMQAPARSAWRSGALHVEPELAAVLAQTGPAADYLDFETAFPAIPLYAGMRPYQQVPFQWSLHGLDAAGHVTHHEFLADPHTDPRRPFVDTLVHVLREPNGPILVWSGFESCRLADLAAAWPDRACELAAVQERLVDLLPIVREHIYHPEFFGSFSIKNVAPVLAPAVRYDDLDGIADGGAAATALVRLARGAVESADEEARVRHALLAYCRRDTLALLELHAELRRLAAAAVAGSGR